MKINQDALHRAVTHGLISTQQANDLWDFLSQKKADTPAFIPVHILYYLGGCIAIGAMTLFMNLGWETFGGQGIAFIALAYTLISLAFAEYFQKQNTLQIPTGIMATLAVAMVPLCVYGIQTQLGMFADNTTYKSFHAIIDSRWIIIELATVAAGLLTLWRYRLSFILMPISVALFYLSMDLAPWFTKEEQFYWDLHPFIAKWFGLCMLVVALVTDLKDRSDKDYAFWLYFFGVMTLWGGVSYSHSGLLTLKLLYLGFNLLLIAVGTCLMRKVFVVFGGIGTLLVLGNLSRTYFKDSLAFPFTLTILGLLTVAIGIWWQRHDAAIQKQVARLLPGVLIALRERRG